MKNSAAPLHRASFVWLRRAGNLTSVISENRLRTGELLQCETSWVFLHAEQKTQRAPRGDVCRNEFTLVFSVTLSSEMFSVSNSVFSFFLFLSRGREMEEIKTHLGPYDAHLFCIVISDKSPCEAVKNTVRMFFCRSRDVSFRNG